MQIFDSTNQLIIDVPVDDKSYRNKEIMGDNEVTLYFSLPDYIELPIGAWCEFKAERYYLLNPQNFTMKHTRNWEYTVVMETYQSLTKLAKFKFFTKNGNVVDSPYELKFSLTETPEHFARLFVDNMNLSDPSGGWTAGQCISSDAVTIDFNHDACSDVLDKIADAFETEWEIEGKTVHFWKVEKLKDFPVPLEYGKDKGLLPGLGRNNLSSSFVINRVFIEGGERNIDRSKYGSDQLHMPVNMQITYNGIAYKTNETGTYIERVNRSAHVVEDSIDLTKIYPKREGTVSGVVVVDAAKSLYDFIDSSIPASLDYSQMLIADETMMVAFQTGQLAGKEFEVSYIHAQRRFEIVPTTEVGLPLPSGSLIPEVGDRYMVFNIMLPQDYINLAQTEMMNEAVKYLHDNEQQKFTYTAKLDEIYAKRHWLEIGGYLNAGYFVRLTDSRFLPEPVVIRIVGVKEYVNKPQQPELTISNEATGKGIGSVLNELNGKDQEIARKSTEVARYSQRQWRDLKQTTDMLTAAIAGFTDAISPISVQTMQLIVGDESLQFRFVNNKTNPQQVNYVINYDSVTKKLTCPAGVLQHMTLEIDMSSNHAAGEYKFWDVSAYISPALTDPAPGYYLYVKASKTNSMATFLLSETAISMEQVAGYYHFLAGILNSEVDDIRSFATMFGYTEILPGRINVEKIVSPDGKTYFDVLNGVISGRITFINSSGQTQSVADAVAGLQQEIEDIEVSGSGNVNFRTAFGAFPSPPYKKGDTWSDTRDIRICIISKPLITDVYEAADWDYSSKYDSTQTVIDGGIVTSGTIQLVGDGGNVLSGITGNGLGSGSVRMWAGADWANRGAAPFRVLQDGTMYASKAIIEGNIKAGSIGGFVINDTSISSINGRLILSSASSGRISSYDESGAQASFESGTLVIAKDNKQITLRFSQTGANPSIFIDDFNTSKEVIINQDYFQIRQDVTRSLLDKDGLTIFNNNFYVTRSLTRNSFVLTGLPSSVSGLSAGDVWRDGSGYLRVV